MTRDVIDRLVRPANPVPDPKMLGADSVSTLHEQMRNEMQQQIDIDHVEDETTGNKGGWQWIRIAAAVTAVIGVYVLFQASEGSDVAAERTPVEIATEYLEAYADFDADRVESMLAEDATVLPWESYEPRDWHNDLRFLEAAGFQIFAGECSEVSPSSGVALVRCGYQAHGLGSDQIGLEPFGGHQFQVIVEDGQVTFSGLGFNFSEFSETMWWPFQSWIKENHPEDFSVLYEDETLSRQSDSAITLWEQRVQDYAEFNNSQP